MHARPGDAGSDVAYARLFDLIRHVTSSRDVDELLRRVVRGVVEGLGFGHAVVSQRRGGVLVATHAWSASGEPDAVLGHEVPLEVLEDLHGRAEHWGVLRYVPHHRLPARGEGAIAVADPLSTTTCLDPGLVDGHGDAGDAGDADGARWHPLDVLSAPLVSPTGEVLGTMSVDLPPGLELPDAHLRELLEMYVVQAGLALSHAQQRERLERRMRLARMVPDVSSRARLADLGAVLENAARTITETLGARQTFLRCFAGDPDGHREVLVTHPSYGPETPPIRDLTADLREHAWPRRRSVVVDLADPSSDDLPRSLPALVERIPPGAQGSMVLLGFGVGEEMFGEIGLITGHGSPPLDAEEDQALHDVAAELGQLVLNARLYERESRLVTQLQELDRYKGELIATISHELKTPLTSIIGHAELLDDDPETSTSVRAITRNAFRLDRLIANLLSYSRLHEPRAHERKPVDLASLCQAAIELLSLQASQAEIAWEVDLPRGGVLVRGDVDELGRVVDNLIGNAVKYSHPGGRVWVGARYEGTDALVAVRDVGLGISRGDQAHLFSPFHRSSNPAALSLPGTGLGLAISRRIAELHGGGISLESALGEGSTFTLRLPAARPDDDA